MNFSSGFGSSGSLNDTLQGELRAGLALPVRNDPRIAWAVAEPDGAADEGSGALWLDESLDDAEVVGRGGQLEVLAREQK